MGILLILAQVALIILDYGAHALHLSEWLIWLPAILLGTLWLIGCLLGGKTLILDRFTQMYR